MTNSRKRHRASVPHGVRHSARSRSSRRRPSGRGVSADAEPADPRVGLSPRSYDAGIASRGVTLRAHRDRPPGCFDPANARDFGFLNSDLAIEGDHAVVGGFRGFQIWNIADRTTRPSSRASSVRAGRVIPSCWGNLRIHVVREPVAHRLRYAVRRRADTAFRGVRIFDISNPAVPVQVAAVQTCRGSHTHTLVPDRATIARTLRLQLRHGGRPLGDAHRPAGELLRGRNADPDREPVVDRRHQGAALRRRRTRRS